MLVVVGMAAGLAYCGFLVYDALAVEGYDSATVVSDLEAEGAPYGQLLRSLDAVSAVLTLVLVPYLWWALPCGIWRHVAVWSTVTFAVLGVPAGLVPLACGEEASGCAETSAEEVQVLLHNGFSIISTTALIIGAAAVALTVRRAGPRWLRWAGWTTVAIQVATGLAFAVGYLTDEDGLIGRVQRVEIVGIGAWIVCLAVYAATHGVSAAAARRDPAGPHPAGAQPPGRS